MWIRFLGIWCLVCLLGATAQQRIVPIGDSITESAQGYASYRYHLWKQIDNADLCADFLGVHAGVAGGAPLFDDFDQDHAGFSGVTAVGIEALMNAFPAMVPATDIALVHLGSNDILQALALGVPADLRRAQSAMVGIIGHLRARNPDVKIAVARIVPIPSAPALVAAWNGYYLPALLALSTPASPVILVDQFTGFSYPAFYRDAVHPNDAGEQLMASRWFAAITSNGWLPSGVPCVATLSPGCVQPVTGAAPPALAKISSGPPVPGSTLSLEIGNLPAGTDAVILVVGASLATAPASWMGCNVHPGLDVLVFSVPISGIVSLALPVPTEIPLGFHFYIQAVTDGPGIGDEATSNGLQLTVF